MGLELIEKPKSREWSTGGNPSCKRSYIVLGTADDGLRIDAGSPCIDAGDNSAVPADVSDLDGDGDTVEPLPLDVTGCPRFVDDPSTPDTGNGAPPVVDMGAYEYQP